MIEFEIDPNLVREAIMKGCKLHVRVDPARGTKRVKLGYPSPYTREPQTLKVWKAA